MKLSELFKYINVKSNQDIDIFLVTSNINLVDEHTIFIPYVGQKFDSYQYVELALEKKAIVLGDYYYDHPSYFCVFDNIMLAGILSQALLNFPTNKCKVIGISGTNGKSSVANFINVMLQKDQKNTLLIGTDGIFYNDCFISENQTTPSYEVFAKLFKMYKDKLDYVVMEVSSHAIAQKRISGLSFDMIIYTNIGHDHLDYHSSFCAYKSIKLELIHYLKSDGIVVLNTDDKNLKGYLDFINYPTLTYGINGDIKLDQIDYVDNKLSFKINDQQFAFTMLGLYNAYNLAAAYACIDYFMQKGEMYLKGLSTTKGRLEVVYDEDVLVLVDYAHTLEAYAQVAQNVNVLKTNRQGKSWLVFGMGGNRDIQKRYKIGKVIQSFDYLIITSDNNRNETFDNIAADIVSGLKDTPYKLIENRSEATKYALLNALENDIIIVAGKGYETYQESNNQRTPYSDYEEIAKHLKQRGLLYEL